MTQIERQNIRDNRGGRLARVVRDILRNERTMGMGRVASIVRPGEITLEGRVERVLVAGNITPMVGSSIPWVKTRDGRLIACYNVPVQRPGPVSQILDLGDVGVVAELLFGEGLDVGWHYYAACFPPEQGGSVMGSYNPRPPSWIRTRQARAPIISGLNLAYNVGGGSFQSDPEGIGNWYELAFTFFNAEDGSQETTPSTPVYISTNPLGLPTPYSYSISLDLPSSGLARNGGVRVYCSIGTAFEGQGPFQRCFEFMGESTPGYDIYDHLRVTVEGPDTGPEPPAENNLWLCRVGLEVFANEDEPPTVMDQGVDKILLYRTPNALPDYGGDEPPYIGYIGEVAVPVTAIQAKDFCFIDDGIVPGEPPSLPWEEE